ncbi:MAG: hypothetical protein BWK76_07665 [Desulfobulbaceae bacterium A2]|nr:MAG: hypothetical protein BWK76_07665 [Desulfobulbaceae bacterium A2]
MFVTIARQPIFTLHKRLHAYELLFRDTVGASLEAMGGDRATTSLLSSTFLTEGIEKISQHRPAFINFTEPLLLQKLPASFPSTKLVVEILEQVQPTAEVLDVVAELADAGYTIALDDFVYERRFEPLAALAHIIKVDFRKSTADDIDRILHRLSRYRLKFLAEKVETHEEFDRAARLGFSYFQGYFFSQPEPVHIKEIATTKIILIKLLAEVNQHSTSVDRLGEIVNHDVGISYKLLRYINSSYFYLLHEVDSIRQAIVFLGENGVRRFITLVIISELASHKPPELMRLSVLRARFCELLAEHCSQGLSTEHAFMLGLFSLVDAILDSPMTALLPKLPLTDDITEALLGKGGPMAPLLQAVRSYEHKDIQPCLQALAVLGIDPQEIYPCYKEAVRYCSFLESGNA